MKEEENSIKNNSGNLSDKGLMTNNDKSPNTNVSSREKVDNALDSAGSQYLQKMGLSKGMADKAVKNNGGFFSPTNTLASKFAKNYSRNKLAKGLDKINGNNDQNHGRNLLNGLGNTVSPEQQKKNSEHSRRISQLFRDLSQLRNPNSSEEKNNENSKSSGLGKNIFGSKSEEKKGRSKASSNSDMVGAIFSSPIAKKVVLIAAPAFFLLLMLFVVITSVLGSNDAEYNDAMGIAASSGEVEISNINYSEDAKAFYDRVAEVKNEYSANGKNVDIAYISGAYYILITNDSSITYESMTKEKIEEIADAMLDENGSFSEDTFKENLINNVLLSYFPDSTETDRTKMAKEIIEYGVRFRSYLGDNTSSSESIASGTCSYDIKSVSPSKGVNKSLNIKVSDLHVRLLECGGNTPIAGEELIPFEDYILGVAFGEIGNGYPEEAIKAQLVAARSYALVRPSAMNNAVGLKLEQENDKWILQLRNCVNDQAYCNPNLGCSSASYSCGDASTIHSGHNFATKCLGGQILAPEDKMRSIAASVQGEVIVNAQDSIINAPYVSTDQNELRTLAEQGLNYKQILLQKYNNGKRDMGATAIKKMNCSASVSTGAFASWKQSATPWAKIKLGNSNATISHAGCLATSIAILIAKSGVATTVDGEFNPGSFVKKVGQYGAFGPQGDFTNYTLVSHAAPNFRYVNSVDLVGNAAQKAATIKSILDQGYYPMAKVNYGGHWVAIDSVSGTTVNMMDPGSQSTNLWSEYSVAGTVRIVYFQAL